MNTFQSSINCPDCGNVIPIDTKQLLIGARFNCFNCKVSIGLSSESKNIVEDTVQKFEKLKNVKNLRK